MADGGLLALAYTEGSHRESSGHAAYRANRKGNMQVDIIYCLVPKSYWETWEGKETYLPRDYEQEGFIHATKSEELLGKVANRVYKDFTDKLYVLVIQEQKIASCGQV